MSMTPSWVMLGFALGAGFVLALPSREKKPAPPVRIVEVPKPVLRDKLTTIEAVFEAWRQFAIWDEDTNTTQFAFWNAETHDFSEYYEVKRDAGELYFRSIPILTRVNADYGDKLPPECPLRFAHWWKLNVTADDPPMPLKRERMKNQPVPLPPLQPKMAPMPPPVPAVEIVKPEIAIPLQELRK